MEKPKYIEGMYAFIFLCLGIVFLIMGCLCFIGIMKPSANSQVQDPVVMGQVFSAIGLIFCAVQTVFRVMKHQQERRHKELLANGVKLTGTVEKVYLQNGVRFGRKSPFRICYTYCCQGEVYHHKSCLLWDNPNFDKGDSIGVYANELGESTLSL